MSEQGFDLEAAFFRRFSADAASSLGAFALRLREALPERVAIERKRGLFGRRGDITGVSVSLGERVWRLAVERGRLDARVSMVVRGITLNTKPLDPAAWFADLAAATKSASDEARTLSVALDAFMRH